MPDILDGKLHGLYGHEMHLHRVVSFQTLGAVEMKSFRISHL